MTIPRRLAGSSIGGIRETQEMLDHCAEKNITSDVEVIPIERIEGAYERTVKSDVRHRCVIDMKTLKSRETKRLQRRKDGNEETKARKL